MNIIKVEDNVPSDVSVAKTSQTVVLQFKDPRGRLTYQVTVSNESGKGKDLTMVKVDKPHQFDQDFVWKPNSESMSRDHPNGYDFLSEERDCLDQFDHIQSLEKAEGKPCVQCGLPILSDNSMRARNRAIVREIPLDVLALSEKGSFNYQMNYWWTNLPRSRGQVICGECFWK